MRSMTNNVHIFPFKYYLHTNKTVLTDILDSSNVSDENILSNCVC